jgi:FixJ family two-component response regulator
MSNATPFVVVVDDAESVTRAIKRLSCSTGLESDTVKIGIEFLDVFESIPSYR